MSRLITLALGLLLSVTALASDLSLSGFNDRFTLTRNADNKVVMVKLKRAITRFSVRPFLEQLKADLTREQASLNGLSAVEREAEIDRLMADLGVDPAAMNEAPEAAKIREALMNIPNIDVEATFRELDKGDFWTEFQRRMEEALAFIDPSILANLEDPRFFYKKNVTYTVVEWALKQAAKQFSSVPVLSIASFVVVRVHDMILEQRHFHHNMLLHYFETIPETKLGMTKEEVDRTVSSIHEYRIEAVNVFESNRAARDWLNYGMDKFYVMVRTGNSRVRDWEGSAGLGFSDVRRLNFGFAAVTHEGARKIYHLHHSAHLLTSSPALAYDYSEPKKVKRYRTLMNLAGVALGFINMPGWIKSAADTFLSSMYVQQVRMEGALVGYFESTGDSAMIDRIYAQRANFYILR